MGRTILAELTPEHLKERWPEYTRLGGTVPAYGLYARHVNRIAVRDVHFSTKTPDARAAMVFVDVGEAITGDPSKPMSR